LSKSSDKLNGILNIEPLPAPQINWEPLLFSAIGLLAILVIAVLIYARYFSARGITKQKIRKLNCNFEQLQIDSHNVAFQLAHIMQQNLRIHTLSQTTKLPKQLESHQARWDSFIQHLCIARYSSNEYPIKKMRILFSDVEFFLGHWR